MSVAGICFTKNGAALLQRLTSVFPDARWYAKGRRLRDDLPAGFAFVEGGQDELQAWAGERFADADTILFVGATGIAVRAIAPHVKDKTSDPAVLCVDEQGRHCIPLLSGHIGGANEAAGQIAAALGGTAVITTATDLHGAFAVDVFATKNDCVISDMELAKEVASELVDGGTVDLFSEFPIEGEVPGGLRLLSEEEWTKRDGGGLSVYVGVQNPAPAKTEILRLIPRVCTLGIGCRKGTGEEAIRALAERVLSESSIDQAAVRRVATIEQKKDEPGLFAFCEGAGLALVSYTAEELRAVEGDFSASEFVESTVGVDNVCERAAARDGGRLLVKKTSGDGVTCAVAEEERVLRF